MADGCLADTARNSSDMARLADDMYMVKSVLSGSIEMEILLGKEVSGVVLHVFFNT